MRIKRIIAEKRRTAIDRNYAADEMSDLRRVLKHLTHAQKRKRQAKLAGYAKQRSVRQTKTARGGAGLGRA